MKQTKITDFVKPVPKPDPKKFSSLRYVDEYCK